MTISKTQSSFYRRLYVAYLVARDVDSLPAIIDATGMPRRTAQDTLAALTELDIDCSFEPTPGKPHNIGQYVIRDWGPFDPDWLDQHAERLCKALGYPPLA